ncbi:hypothetical protein DK427_06470 [Methylobacterium radiodurans]|uniref:Uncharacterized protein n=1 Tax=Methylobacterium radiodurans TaxID=2202828 RepID=A0A2U8VP61_9HYPH|nr:hypothetical protein DK427_06470 [Methylobacterium radiodurans]
MAPPKVGYPLRVNSIAILYEPTPLAASSNISRMIAAFASTTIQPSPLLSSQPGPIVENGMPSTALRRFVSIT